MDKSLKQLKQLKEKDEGRDRRWWGTPTCLAARDFRGYDMSGNSRQKNIFHETRPSLKYDCVSAGLLITDSV